MDKNKKSPVLSFLKNNLKDIGSAEKQQKRKEQNFREEWSKWGNPKKGQG
ncbi:MAG TPA: hypothetical protein GX693_05535 [Firmicutes bacterium]|nr:hypothetical protein [Bacillota bacterium]